MQPFVIRNRSPIPSFACFSRRQSNNPPQLIVSCSSPLHADKNEAGVTRTAGNPCMLYTSATHNPVDQLSPASRYTTLSRVAQLGLGFAISTLGVCRVCRLTCCRSQPLCQDGFFRIPNQALRGLHTVVDGRMLDTDRGYQLRSLFSVMTPRCFPLRLPMYQH
ncbi:hypothetical protein F4803DRAFT_479588 [Xylaria telfairii]|nr:hypothetical protein F4803DRAFT_479588 [Xylaria telfairii]